LRAMAPALGASRPGVRFPCATATCAAQPSLSPRRHSCLAAARPLASCLVYTFSPRTLPVRSAERRWECDQSVTRYGNEHHRSARRSSCSARVALPARSAQGRQVGATASALARRALRGWRRWLVSGRACLHPLGSEAGSNPAGLPPLPLPASKPPARLQPRIRIATLPRGRPQVLGRKVGNAAANCTGSITGTIPRNCNDSDAVRSGRLPILLFSRSPTSLLPVGRGLSWQSSTAPDFIWRTRYCEWQELCPKVHPDYGSPSPPAMQRYTFRRGGPPPKARFVLCH
jgi:hypothetical protein